MMKLKFTMLITILYLFHMTITVFADSIIFKDYENLYEFIILDTRVNYFNNGKISMVVKNSDTNANHNLFSDLDKLVIQQAPAEYQDEHWGINQDLIYIINSEHLCLEIYIYKLIIEGKPYAMIRNMPSPFSSRNDCLADYTKVKKLFEDFQTKYKIKFKDISEDDENYHIYSFLNAYDVVKAYEDRSLRLEQTVTRAEFIRMLISEETIHAYGILPKVFNDVTEDYYYYPYINVAFESGYIMGDGNGNFNPDDPVTRQDIYLITARAYGFITKKDGHLYQEKRKIEDVSDYAYPGVNALLVNGTITEAQDLKKPATRKDAAVTLFYARFIENYGLPRETAD